MLDVLTDAQWQAVESQHPQDHFTLASAENVERLWGEVRVVLAHRDDDLELSQLRDTCLWDTSDPDNDDFLMTVDMAAGLRVASETVKPSSLYPAGPDGVPRGSTVARHVVRELLALRARLVRDLEEHVRRSHAPQEVTVVRRQSRHGETVDVYASPAAAAHDLAYDLRTSWDNISDADHIPNTPPDDDQAVVDLYRSTQSSTDEDYIDVYEERVGGARTAPTPPPTLTLLRWGSTGHHWFSAHCDARSARRDLARQVRQAWGDMARRVGLAPHAPSDDAAVLRVFFGLGGRTGHDTYDLMTLEVNGDIDRNQYAPGQVLGELMDAAHHMHEDTVLRTLACRAGLLWECSCRWFNVAADHVCDSCGMPRATVE